MQSMVDRSQERQPTPEKATPLVREALGDHRRDAVAHGDAVEGIRDLHRALLVGDDNQLRALLQLLEDGQQARQTSAEQPWRDSALPRNSQQSTIMTQIAPTKRK